MQNTTILYCIVIAICVAEAIAQTCVKYFHNGNGYLYFFLAVMFYSLVCFLLHKSFYYKNSMGLTNVIWSGVSVLTVALFGILIFHEKIHFHDVIAALMITSGLMIIRYTD